jgi:hypothetical protein
MSNKVPDRAEAERKNCSRIPPDMAGNRAPAGLNAINFESGPVARGTLFCFNPAMR